MIGSLIHSLRSGLLSLGAILFFILPCVSQPVISLTNHQSMVNVGKFLVLLEDKSEKLTYEQVLAPAYAAQFVPSQQDVPNFGNTQSVIWCRFRMSNATEEDAYLIIENPVLDSVALFSPSTEGYQVALGGDDLPFKHRQWQINHQLFRLTVPAHTTQTFHLRLRSQTVLRFPLKVGTLHAIIDHNHRNDLVQGIYFGIIFLVLLYNLVMYYAIRDVTYLYYLTYVVCIAAFIAYLQGYAYEFLWSEFPDLNYYANNILPSLVGLFSILFTTKFLHTPQIVPQLHKGFYLFIACFSAAILFTVAGAASLGLTFVQITSLALAFYIFTLAIIVISKGYQPARFYLIAWTSFLVGTVVFILQSMHLLPFNTYTYYSLQAGSVTEVLLLSYALADKINIYRKEKENAQLEMFQALKEREKLIREQNRILEQKVAERTEEIHQKNIVLEHQKEEISAQADTLQEINQMKSHFFANISHEFRTPLTLIIGPLEQLLTKVAESPSLQVQYQMMHRNAQRLLLLINQLLDLSKVEAGKMTLDTKPGDLVQFLRRVVRSFESLAERRHIDLRLQYPHHKVWVLFDPDKLEKVVNNLLSNAFKFTPEGGTISFSLSFSPALVETNQSASDLPPLTKAEIIVQDSGVGIPADRVNKIFERFYQVDNTQTREQEGTGIGLALIKELVDLHHGHISVSSTLGKGTAFTMHLPFQVVPTDDSQAKEIWIESEIEPLNQTIFSATPSEILPEANRKSSDHLPLKESRPSVLIVEDNSDMRAYIRENLATFCRVTEASHGKMGFEKAVATVPDLIISDVMMPGMDGMELCKRLKTDELTSHIPVILLTARASGDSKVEGLETGADDYITKPFEARELQVRVKNLIEGRHKLRQRFSREVILQPKDIAITSADERFLQRATDVVERYLSDTDFGVETFAREIAMSHMQLYRKLQALTDQSPSIFIRSLRMQRAALLLAKKSATVSEIAYQVGYNDPSYFTKCFHQQFGQTPSEYANSHSDITIP
ncbi:MAG: 7TM diverse intracellular signaling domain-containing protein [Bacteroidota bacterium]